MSNEGVEPLTLYSSWRGLIASILAPSLLIGTSLGAMIWAGRVAVLAAIIAAVGVLLGVVVLVDLPRRCLVTQEGITRRCPLRAQLLPWDQITSIARTPGTTFTGHKEAGTGRLSRGMGGLSAVAGKRRYLLLDHVEGAEEYAALARCVGAWAPGVSLRASPPPDQAPPTWLYHKRRDRS